MVVFKLLYLKNGYIIQKRRRWHIIIAIDGASKRNGKPDCLSSGVAAIFHDDGEILLKPRIETQSTNQRGELNGLLEALAYGLGYIQDKEDKDIIIISDSQYLCNTVMKDWVGKWERQDWCGSNGPVKNADMWAVALSMLNAIREQGGDVYMNWTKGHLLAYTEGNINKALEEDASGYVLYDRLYTLGNRPSEYGRIAKAFNNKRVEQEYPTLPEAIAVQWVIYNTVADCVASYMVKKVDEAQKLADEAAFIEWLSDI